MFKVIPFATIAFAVSAVFLLASTSVFAEYSQKQNEIDDKGSDQQSQSNPSAKKQGDKNKKDSSENRDHNSNNGSGMDKSHSSETDNKRSY